jgi:hypothetical protein
MKLLTKAITDKLPKLYATDGTPATERTVVAKFFAPWSRWTWYVLEGEPDTESGTEDFLFFGLVNGLERELGYFSLNELQSLRGPFGLGIERDRGWTPITLAELETRLAEGRHA